MLIGYVIASNMYMIVDTADDVNNKMTPE